MSPQHSPGHRNCPACQREAELDEVGLRGMLFGEAAGVFSGVRAVYLSKWSQRDHRNYVKALTQFFGELRLAEITIGHIRSYQKWRREPGEQRVVNNRVREIHAGPAKVNQELSFLHQLLVEAGCWTFDGLYKPLPLPRRRTVGQALSEEDEERLFLVAGSRKRWVVAYCCALIMANTGAGPGELINLRMADINLGEKFIHVVEGTKNEEGRVRELPLNEAAAWAVEVLVRRYKKLVRRWGMREAPEHYLLPHRADRGCVAGDPTRPMYSFAKAWGNLRDAAGLPTLRCYDLRHHFLTRLMENAEISEQTIEDIAGHLSSAMKRRYSHIRRAAREAAVSKVVSGGKYFRAAAGD